jgi:hypothetical protein
MTPLTNLCRRDGFPLPDYQGADDQKPDGWLEIGDVGGLPSNVAHRELFYQAEA